MAHIKPPAMQRVKSSIISHTGMDAVSTGVLKPVKFAGCANRA
jgi:hypothetical protein